MNDAVFSPKMQKMMVGAILIAGLMLFIAVLAMIVVTYNLKSELQENRRETVENRKIGCISRYLDGQKFANECRQYIDGGIESP